MVLPYRPWPRRGPYAPFAFHPALCELPPLTAAQAGEGRAGALALPHTKPPC